jgi:hypothetical protein
MSLFGKVLVGLNLLVAALFGFLVLQDWGRRQAWEYQVFRHEVALRGLPVEGNDEGWELVQSPTRDLTDATLADMFKPAGGNPVRTQQQEVETLRKNVIDRLTDSKTAEEKLNAVAGSLLALAESGEERDRIWQQVLAVRAERDPNARAQQAGKLADQFVIELNGIFDRVLQPLQTADNPARPSRALAEKRQAIAHLLYNLQPDAADHQRVQVVVGLEAYVREADSQALALADMSQRVQRLMDDDRTAFELQYHPLVQRIRLLSEQLHELQGKLKEQQEVKQKHNELVQARETDAEELRKQIEKARADLAVAVAKQTETEKALFAALQKGRDAMKENLKLEQDIRRHETGR